jgi:hypothetical protein
MAGCTRLHGKCKDTQELNARMPEVSSVSRWAPAYNVEHNEAEGQPQGVLCPKPALQTLNLKGMNTSSQR